MALTCVLYTSSYKYLGLVFDEYMSFNDGTKLLSGSAGTAFKVVPESSSGS